MKGKSYYLIEIYKFYINLPILGKFGRFRAKWTVPPGTLPFSSHSRTPVGQFLPDHHAPEMIMLLAGNDCRPAPALLGFRWLSGGRVALFYLLSDDRCACDLRSFGSVTLSSSRCASGEAIPFYMKTM